MAPSWILRTVSTYSFCDLRCAPAITVSFNCSDFFAAQELCRRLSATSAAANEPGAQPLVTGAANQLRLEDREGSGPHARRFLQEGSSRFSLHGLLPRQILSGMVSAGRSDDLHHGELARRGRQMIRFLLADSATRDQNVAGAAAGTILHLRDRVCILHELYQPR